MTDTVHLPTMRRKVWEIATRLRADIAAATGLSPNQRVAQRRIVARFEREMLMAAGFEPCPACDGLYLDLPKHDRKRHPARPR